MDGSTSDPTVDDFVAVKASKSHKVQRTSTSGLQQVQYQSVKNYKIPQRSIGDRIWFGTRGSEVQILSPRPFIFKQIHAFKSPENSGVGKNVTLVRLRIFS